VLFDFLIGNRKKKGVIPFTLASLLITLFAFSYFLFGCFLLFVIRIIFLLPLGSMKSRKYIFHWTMMIFCRSLIYIMANFKKEVVNRHLANYEKPSIIISNHHSFIDILIMLMFHPKVVMVTNDWVYYSPFFGKSVQYADFIPASKGLESQLDKIQKLVNEGFSIMVFPEGSRSGAFELRRFHKGAFYLADEFQLDIQPIVLHGTSLVMPKGDDFYLKNNLTTIQFLPRISHDDARFGTNYSERTKKIAEYFKTEYQQLRRSRETPDFFKDLLIKNFIYKGPVLEWYLRIKYKLEEGYQLFHELIPPCGRVVDLGCGYGFITFALGLSSSKREIFGIDYDEEKIKVAQECPVRPKNIAFAQSDVVNAEYGCADVFLISDVLHYLTPEEQQQVLTKMANHLNEGGRIIIRDGDRAKEERHKGTLLTEFFSTGIGFNKTRNKLNYISTAMIESYAEVHNLELEIIDNTKRTSNLIFVLKRKDVRNGKF
jgi:1-acyl-sn-glycerol-3-phosphate acyltransferase